MAILLGTELVEKKADRGKKYSLRKGINTEKTNNKNNKQQTADITFKAKGKETKN